MCQYFTSEPLNIMTVFTQQYSVTLLYLLAREIVPLSDYVRDVITEGRGEGCHFADEIDQKRVFGFFFVMLHGSIWSFLMQT